MAQSCDGLDESRRGRFINRFIEAPRIIDTINEIVKLVRAASARDDSRYLDMRINLLAEQGYSASAGKARIRFHYTIYRRISMNA